MGPWLDPIPLINVPRGLHVNRESYKGTCTWRSRRLTQLYHFNWVFLYQTAVGRMLEELAANNSYHLLEAVGEKEQLFTKSVRFKKLSFSPFKNHMKQMTVIVTLI